ncbi:MAG: DUF488 domain-containing protein [Candidatus Altiarchaeota archaeon]|nr:DUF488 domain-containing protein [Candidatus Altiarchaeota archaeon]
MKLFTIGHSTRSLEDFIGLLKEYGIDEVIDVRSIPWSRHNPQFNRETLPRALKEKGVDYLHMAGLGGLRKARKDSVNVGLTNASFRGYADHMQSKEFEESLNTLPELAKKKKLALMCAEAIPWRCHRSLISDALTARKIDVEHILGPGRSQPHKMTPEARMVGRKIVYLGA